jgi:uncharacterized membrane protein
VAVFGMLMVLLYLVGIVVVILVVVAIFQIKNSSVEIAKKLDKLNEIYELLREKKN